LTIKGKEALAGGNWGKGTGKIYSLDRGNRGGKFIVVQKNCCEQQSTTTKRGSDHKKTARAFVVGIREKL